MGNDQSLEMDGGALALQSQGVEHLWSLQLNRGKTGQGEGVCVFSRTNGNGTPDQLCKAGLEHLRLLRHPNIVKFLGTQQSYDKLMIVTEPVIPVFRVLEGMSVEGLVMGWRGVACALDFLHGKAKLSHNNLCEECVYVSTVDSQWKVGGFEAARHFKKIDASFISDISSIRNEKATPPEDKGKTNPRDVPCHARDVWAFGQLMLVLLEDTALEGHMDEAVFDYIRDSMLHSDPHLRPVAMEVMSQPFMRNISSELCDFLSKLTLKTRQEKDQFFLDLPRQLHSLPQAVVAEHIVPLLINPLVMAEPHARDSLWKHLLLPISSTKPRPPVFDPSQPCPLLEKDLFHAHILPLLLNLLESRELHVRMTLLSHLSSFASIISRQDLVATVLPEVLIGLKDSRGDVVSATLHTLAELVPLLGPEAVIGTSRRNVFIDSQPRTKSLPVVEGKGTSSPSQVIKAPPKRKTTPPPPSKISREERKERMREKREQQRLKKNAQNKLGMVADHSTRPLLGGVASSADVSDEDAPIIAVPSSDSAPQYSPSVSHDEKEEEEEKWEGLEVTEKHNSFDKGFGSKDEGSPTFSNHHRAFLPVATSMTPNERGDEVKGESEEEEEWSGFDDDVMGGGAGWGSAWTTESDFRTDSVASSHSVGDTRETTPITTPTGSGRGKLKLKSSRKPSEEQEASPAGGEKKTLAAVRSPKTNSTSTKSTGLEKKMKGRLKKDDIERLEQQALQAAAEPDFFADMAPAIRGKGSLLASPKTDVEKAEPVVSSSALQYQPTEQVEGDGWTGEEEEGWDDF